MRSATIGRRSAVSFQTSLTQRKIIVEYLEFVQPSGRGAIPHRR